MKKKTQMKTTQKTTPESDTEQTGKSYFETMNLTRDDIRNLIEQALDETPITIIINEEEKPIHINTN